MNQAISMVNMINSLTHRPISIPNKHSSDLVALATWKTVVTHERFACEISRHPRP